MMMVHSITKNTKFIYTKKILLNFLKCLKATEFVINEKGEEVISERHQKDFKKPSEEITEEVTEEVKTTEDFTDVNFEDI